MITKIIKGLMKKILNIFFPIINKIYKHFPNMIINIFYKYKYRIK